MYPAVIGERHFGVVVPVRGQDHNAARFQFGVGGPNAVGGMGTLPVRRGLGAGVGVFALDRHTVGFAVVQHPLLSSRFPLTQSRAVSRPCLAMILDRWVPWLLWWEGRRVAFAL